MSYVFFQLLVLDAKSVSLSITAKMWRMFAKMIMKSQRNAKMENYATITAKVWPIADLLIAIGDQSFGIARWSPIFSWKEDRMVIAIAKFDDRDLFDIFHFTKMTNYFQPFVVLKCLKYFQ